MAFTLYDYKQNQLVRSFMRYELGFYKIPPLFFLFLSHSHSLDSLCGSTLGSLANGTSSRNGKGRKRKKEHLSLHYRHAVCEIHIHIDGLFSLEVQVHVDCV